MKNKPWSIALLALLVLAILFRAQSAIKSVKAFYQTLQPIIHHPRASHQEKLTMKWSYSMPYVYFLQEHTSKDSAILLSKPKKYASKAWIITRADNAYCLFFPRKITPYKKNNIPKKKDSYPTYYLVAGGKLPEDFQYKRAWQLQDGKFVEATINNKQDIYAIFEL